MPARLILAFILTAAAFFALGSFLAKNRTRQRSGYGAACGPIEKNDAPAPASSVELRIHIDASAIELLPDASLHIELPPAPVIDGGP